MYAHIGTHIHALTRAINTRTHVQPLRWIAHIDVEDAETDEAIDDSIRLNAKLKEMELQFAAEDAAKMRPTKPRSEKVFEPHQSPCSHSPLLAPLPS
jgi:hypothetical protein